MEIESWLRAFKQKWQNHDVDGVLGLFDEQVVYYETPFERLEDFDSVAKEWSVINNQNNIELEFDMFSSVGSKHSVIWKLQYEDEKGILKQFAGTYLIELSEEGTCTYFHHSCESI